MLLERSLTLIAENVKIVFQTVQAVVVRDVTSVMTDTSCIIWLMVPAILNVQVDTGEIQTLILVKYVKVHV